VTTGLMAITNPRRSMVSLRVMTVRPQGIMARHRRTLVKGTMGMAMDTTNIVVRIITTTAIRVRRSAMCWGFSARCSLSML